MTAKVLSTKGSSFTDSNRNHDKGKRNFDGIKPEIKTTNGQRKGTKNIGFIATMETIFQQKMKILGLS